MSSLFKLDRARRAPLTPVVHGGLPAEELRALGLDPDAILDFSVNTNPFGPSPRALAAVREADVTRYPDPAATQLRASLSDALGVPADHLLAGNGVVELIWLTARAYLAPGDCALVVGPTFGEYAQASQAAGAEVIGCDAAADDAFTIDLSAVEALLTAHRPQVAYLCNPNNPTGTFVTPAALAPLIQRFQETLFLVDEAYLSFMNQPEEARSCISLGMPHNLLVVRSMTKDCAIPGLRLGYAVGQPEPLASLQSQQPPWTVNALAQAAGVAALGDPEHVTRSLAGVQEAKAYLIEALTRLGLRPLPSHTNFLLIPVGDGAAFQRALLHEGCYVRDCASFGLPQYVRIGVRTLPECRRLAAAIERTQTARGGTRDR